MALYSRPDYYVKTFTAWNCSLGSRMPRFLIPGVNKAKCMPVAPASVPAQVADFNVGSMAGRVRRLARAAPFSAFRSCPAGIRHFSLPPPGHLRKSDSLLRCLCLHWHSGRPAVGNACACAGFERRGGDCRRPGSARRSEAVRATPLRAGIVLTTWRMRLSLLT